MTHQSMIRSISILMTLLCLMSYGAMGQRVITSKSELAAKLRERSAQHKADTSQHQQRESSPSLQQNSELGNAQYYVAGEKPFGIGLESWTAQWWQWVTTIPAEANPLLDKTGEHAAVGQRGNVWFLAENTGGVNEREITIPANVTLFFPVFNAIYFQTPEEGEISEQEIRDLLTEFLSTTSTLEVSLDHQPLPREAIQHTQSNIFTTQFPENNLFSDIGVPKGFYHPCADEGYYVMLKPLSPGTHVLKIRGSDDFFSTYVEYYICVRPETESSLSVTAAARLQ